MEKKKTVSIRQLHRYPEYLKILYGLLEQKETIVTSPTLARLMDYSEEQVRKDLQLVSKDFGKPRVGRNIESLINDIETFLGFNTITDSILIGVGNLGSALLKFDGFKKYGLNIVAGFDRNIAKVGNNINGKTIYPLDKLETMIPKLGISIAIVVVAEDAAQEIVDRLVNCGIKAIWNFAPVQLDVKGDVIVENMDLASSLAILTHKLKKKIETH